MITSKFTPDLHSYSYIIRDGWLQRIKAVPTFATIKRFGTTKMNRIQNADIPFLGCYLMDEQLRPDGDPNAGPPKFVCEVRVGFSVIIENSNDAVAEDNLDACYWTLCNLLTNPAWHRFDMPPPFDPVRIEGITRGSRQHVFGNMSNTNDTPVAELRFDMTFRHREYFPPGPFVDLKRIHVTVAYPWPYDPNAYSPPFTVEYDLPIEGEMTVSDYHLQSPDFARPLLDSPP